MRPTTATLHVRPDLQPALAIAVLAHELQHMLEIALAPEIVDVPSLRAFNRRAEE